jgi:tetraacyldisaccharide 4'-kinase
MNRAASLALTPLSVIYGVVVRARNALYRGGVFRSYRVSAPVISIGNLTTGGTGKTPLVEWIATELAQSNRRVCVLTRGYGRQTSGRVIVSDRDQIRAEVNESGDEASLLAEHLSGKAAVICDANRIAAAHWAIENLGIDVFVLDDGFQHRRIARNLNIVTIDATNPWGNGRLLPAGTLREPRRSLARADCILITRSDQSDRVAELESELRTVRSDVPIFLSRMKLMGFRSLTEDESMQTKPAAQVAAFCGVANPESFFTLLRKVGFELTETQTFRDHHYYTQADIDRIVREARAHGAQALITTAKDVVKVRSLSFALPCYVAEIEIDIDRKDQFRELILNAIKT